MLEVHNYDNITSPNSSKPNGEIGNVHKLNIMWHYLDWRAKTRFCIADDIKSKFMKIGRSWNKPVKEGYVGRGHSVCKRSRAWENWQF